MTLLVGSSADPASLAIPIRRIFREIDPRQPLAAIQPYEEIVAASMGTRRLAAWLLSVFAFSSFVLAVVGLYGAVSVLVGQKQREIGVRLVLGARTAEIQRMVFAKGMRPVLQGLATGLLIAAAAVGALDSLLYGVTPFDPTTFAGVA